MKGFTNKLLIGDVRLLYYMNQSVRSNILDKIMPLLTHLGGAIFTISFTLALIVFGNENVRNMGWEVGTSLASSHLIVHLVKRKVNRPRPFIVLKEIEKFNVPICDYSFPSGHTTAAFAIANIMAINMPAFAILILGGAFLVALSRMYLGVHYPSDVLVGLCIATLCAVVTHHYF